MSTPNASQKGGKATVQDILTTKYQSNKPSPSPACKHSQSICPESLPTDLTEKQHPKIIPQTPYSNHSKTPAYRPSSPPKSPSQGHSANISAYKKTISIPPSTNFDQKKRRKKLTLNPHTIQPHRYGALKPTRPIPIRHSSTPLIPSTLVHTSMEALLNRVGKVGTIKVRLALYDHALAGNRSRAAVVEGTFHRAAAGAGVAAVGLLGAGGGFCF